MAFIKKCFSTIFFWQKTPRLFSTRTQSFRIRKKSNLLHFGSGLELIQSNFVQRISNDTSLQPPDKLCRIGHYEKIASDIFIAGCTGLLENYLHLKKPGNLEDVFACVNEFENFERLYGYSDTTKKQIINQFLTYPDNNPIIHCVPSRMETPL